MGTGGYLGGLDLDWERTEFPCVCCGEFIAFAEEAHVATIVVGNLLEQGMQYRPLVFSDNDFLYEPVFFCSHCWDASREELAELTRDVPPINDDFNVIDCNFCRSGIRNGEVLGLCTQGEVLQSRRSPNGNSGGTTFQCTSDDPDIMCIGCINKLSKDVVDHMWNEPVRQYHECAEGTDIRCWRNGCSAQHDDDCANCNQRQQTG